MRILLVGGTGVIGRGAVDVLLRHGHEVRLLSRDAEDDGYWHDKRVAGWPASVTDPGAIESSADGCDAVLHIVGIAREVPPEETFERINIEGTRNVLKEARRARVRRFVYVSSLGANRGSSEYHRSKREGERLTAGFLPEWVIVRLGNVYGPGDDVISRLLEWVRTSPVVPVIGDGRDVFQPIWVEDAAAALVAALERSDVAGRTLEVAGPDRTTFNDLLNRMAALTGRSPTRVTVPTAAVSLSIAAANVLGVELPVTDAQLRMLLERNLITDDAENALTGVLGLVGTSLDEGLRRLIDSFPAQPPDEGVGPMQLKTFAAECVGSAMTPEQLIERFRVRFSVLLPRVLDPSAEPGASTRLYQGATLTLGLPLRGHIQVRVADVAPTEVTLVTLRGHPLAGALRFGASRHREWLRFEVQVFDRAADISDFMLMALGGNALQANTWQELVRAVMREAGGTLVNDVQSESVILDEASTARVEVWLGKLAGKETVSARAETGIRSR